MAVSMIGPKIYCWDRNGKPLAFGKLYTYQARTNTPKPTYQSEDQVVENTNPVILNGEGYANVYLDGSYKMVLKDDNDNEIWSSDPVTSAKLGEWANCFPANYVSSTSFKLAGNQTETYTQGRKVRIDNNTSEYSYSSVVSAAYAAGETSIVVRDPVVTTGIVNSCTSIVSENSSFNAKDLGGYTNYQATNVDDMIDGKPTGWKEGDAVIVHEVGQTWSIYGAWKVATVPVTSISDFEEMSEIDVRDFGAVKYTAGDKLANAAINDAAFLAALDESWSRQTLLVAHEHYCLSQKLTVRQLSPINSWPNTNNQDLYFTGTIENVGTDYWLQIESQSSKIFVKEQVGESTAFGIRVTKQGDLQLEVQWSRGISNQVVYDDAYSHTIYPSFYAGGTNDVLIKDSNAIAVIGGRLGGNFTTESTDPTTSKHGMFIESGTANMVVGTNFEYAKKDSDSWGLVDQGSTTLMVGGYLESCSGGLLNAKGRDSVYNIQILATGVYDQDGIKDEGINNAFHIQTSGTNGPYPPSNNEDSTLAFVYPALSYRVNSTTKIKGPCKELTTTPLLTKWNKLKDSSRQESTDWVAASIGSFTGAVIENSADAYPELGYPKGIAITLPLQSSRDIQYTLNQTGAHLIVQQGSIFTAGGLFYCEYGKVDVMIKVSFADVYYTHTFAVSASDGLCAATHWQALQAKYAGTEGGNPTFSIMMRPTENSKLHIFGLSMYEYKDVGPLPPTDRFTIQPVKTGRPIDGETFSNGYTLNGNERMAPFFLGSQSTMTEFASPLYITGVSQTLPDPARTKMKIARFKNVGGISITLTGDIDDAGTLSLPPEACVELLSDGTKYLILSSHKL